MTFYERLADCEAKLQGTTIRVGFYLAAAIASTRYGCASSTALMFSIASSQSYITPQFQPASTTARHGSARFEKNPCTVLKSFASRAVAQVRPRSSITCTCKYSLWKCIPTRSIGVFPPARKLVILDNPPLYDGARRALFHVSC